MTKWICAVLMTAGMFAATAGTRPAAASDATTIEDVDWGGCRWLCDSNNKWYLTAAACNAACGGGYCEQIC